MGLVVVGSVGCHGVLPLNYLSGGTRGLITTDYIDV